MRSIATIRYVLASVVLTLVCSIVSQAQPADVLKRATEASKLGAEQFKNSQYDAAIVSYSEYIKLRPNASLGWYNRGISYYQRASLNPTQADYRQAIADISQAIKIDPTEYDYRLYRGHSYWRLISVDFQKSSVAAIADYSAAIRLDANRSAAHSGRGQVYFELQQYDKSLTDLNTAIRLDPNDAVPYFFRGKVHHYFKNNTAARADLGRALKLFPNYVAARSYLEYMDDEAKRSNTKIAAKPITQPVVPSAVSPSNRPITDPYMGLKRAQDAESSGDYRGMLDAVDRSLPFIKMESASLPKDDLMTLTYLSLLHKRARAKTALKRYTEGDEDHKKAALDAMANINRHNSRAVESMKKDLIGSGIGIIMGEFETGRAAGICQSAFDDANHWYDTAARERPKEMSVLLSASVHIGAIREICSMTYVSLGAYQEGQNSAKTNRTKKLNEAVASYTEAIRYLTVYRDAYVRRALVYRQLRRNDLAAADEAKAEQLKKR